MEATALSIGKSALSGALSYAKSALAEEVALQLGVRRDQLFITNELEMMQAFLMAAHDERCDNMVVKVWVKQVRDVAYDVEDCLQEFSVRLQKQSWWRIRRTLLDRHRVAKQMKELRANVEDVSQRNMRYNLINGSGSKPATTGGQSVVAGTMSGIDEARRQRDEAKVELVRLINKTDMDLTVVALWGKSISDLGEMSIIKRAYEDPKIHKKFECRAWIVGLMCPFNSTEFMKSVLEQFYLNFLQEAREEEKATLEAQVLKIMGMSKEDDLAHEFKQYLNERSYLIVLNDIHNIEEWDRIKICFPQNRKGSRIIVSTEQVRVASLCVGAETGAPDHKQLFAEQTLHVFYKKGSQAVSSSSASTTIAHNNSMVSTTNIQGGQSEGADETNIVRKGLTRNQTMVAALEESHLVGREKEKSKMIELVAKEATQFQVISVWGMGGLGKTTLVKDIYQKQELNGTFDKRAWVTVMRPFVLEELLRSLVMQLDRESSEKKDIVGLMGSTKKTLLLMSPEELIKELARLLEGKRCLIVFDDVSTIAEWNIIKPIFGRMENTSRIIVTTREENIAKHCSEKQENIYDLKGLEDKDARDLFTKKVFKKTIDFDKQYPLLVEQAELILKKCGGLPLALVTIGGFLANQPKTPLEWRKLNENISAELEMNPELGTIRTVLLRSYDGLPYHLKSCFLYTSIFPEDRRVGRGRLVRRWSAEGYSREVRGKSVEEISDSYFMELISRSIILPSQKSIHSTKGIDSCQVHDLIREIGISKSMEENLVFRLDEGCGSNTKGTARHLAINSNWGGDQSEFESMVDMSRVRSITVFGEWKSFFISDKMSLLRVLDLEDTTGLRDHHLKHIGKLLHLRYLSLRGCDDICHLPDSLGDLRQLETLDIRDTCIVMLPKTIIKLQKLNNLRMGRKSVDEDVSVEDEYPTDASPRVIRYICNAMWLGADNDGMTRCDICNEFCRHLLPAVAMRLDMYGVVVPRGMRKLKALHTLGVVNIARGKAVVRDIKGLTRLRKLAVTGVNKKNGLDLCSAVAGLRRLESLSIRSEGKPGLCGCLDGMSSPPDNLQTLKLYGNLVELPEWIKLLNNLVKLKLRSTMLSDADTAMEVLGNLPNLASLHLLKKSFSEGLCLNFHPGKFPSLVVLELGWVSREKAIKFEEGATPKLELLKICDGWIDSESVSGLPSLSGLKEVVLQGGYYTEELEYLHAELRNGAVVKRV